VENIRRYSISRTHSEQPANNESGASTPSTSRRPSISDSHERIRRDSIKSSASVTAPKSLREWHEQPVNLSEQPPLTEKVNVQILSPTSDLTTPRFFVDNDLASLVNTDEEPSNNPQDEND
jgi:hypothetical protein